MTLNEKIIEILPELSRNERKIAEYFLKYPYDAHRYPAEKIAEICSVSRSAIVRFCHKLGYPGYTEFKRDLVRASKQNRPTDELTSCLDVYENCIQQIRANTNFDEVDRVGDMLLRAGHIVSFGNYHSGLSARQLAFRLNRTGLDCHPITDPTIYENYTDILSQGDVIVILSLGASSSYIEHAKTYRRNRVSVVLITSNPTAELCRHVDCVLPIPSAIYTGNNRPLDDAICMFLMIEVLLENVNRKLSETNEI